MSMRAPLALLVLVAALLAYVLLFERDGPGRTEVEARSGLLVEPLVRDRITRVRIASGDARIVLRREGEGFDETWTLEQPVEAPADSEAAEDYLRSWEYSIPVRTLQSPNAEDLRVFGIDKPEAEVTFEMGRAKVTVILGSGKPVDGGGYVRIAGDDAVSVVGKDVVELFGWTAESFELPADAGAPLLPEQTDDAGPDADAVAP
ncbi:MAG TPA: DUF4340 domain-containing protein [Polyangiales bacterium]|nr:DUF4340 domain-containing protein [Polyangiales bacterium]